MGRPTPAPERNPFVDLVRVASVALIVVGHWLGAVIVRDGGRVLHVNAVELNAPALAPLTWVFQVMPLIFFAGGFANAVSWSRTRTQDLAAGVLERRLERLLRGTLTFILVWVGLVAGARLIAPEAASAYAPSTRHVATPLWFLAIYVPLAVATPALAWLQRRFRGWTIAFLALAIAVAEALRFGGGPPLDAAVQLNSAFVWLLFHQLGVAFAHGDFSEVRHGLLLCLGGIAALIFFASLHRFSPSLIGADDGMVSNTSPPSGNLAAYGVTQIGLALALRPLLLGVLRNARVLRALAWLNARAMAAYLWHSSALAIVGVVWLAFEGPAAPAGTLRWWVERIPWVLACAAVLTVLVPVVTAIPLGRPRAQTPRAAVRQPGWWMLGWGVGFVSVALIQFVRGGFDVQGEPALALIHLLLGLGLAAASLRSDRARSPAAAATILLLVALALLGAFGRGARYGIDATWSLRYAIAVIVFAFGAALEATQSPARPSGDPERQP